MSQVEKHYQQAKAASKKFQRVLSFRADEIEENDDRTVSVVFSSDEWVRMWFGEEKLLHGAENVDLSYFNSGTSPALVDHYTASDYQVGVIESASVDGESGFATIRFGKGQKAEEYYRDVLDGIRTSISVGYEVLKWEIDEEDPSNPKYTATKWTPREISLVTLPADDNAGVIRNERADFIFELEKEDEDVLTRQADGDSKVKKPDTPEAEDRSQEEPTEGRQTPKAKVEGTDYGAEANKIFELARDMNVDTEKAYQAVQKQMSFEDFQGDVLKEMKASRAAIDPNTGELKVDINKENRFEGTDVERKDKDAFRITNLLAGHVEDFKGTVGGAELEICKDEESRRKKAGMQVRGYCVPGSIVGTASEWRNRQAEIAELKHRAIISGTDASGGYLVDSELRPENFIDILYGEFAVSRASMMLTDVQGNIEIPKQDGRVTAAWKGEIIAADESNPTFDTVSLSPKELRVLSQFSRTFAIQSSLDAENLARQNIMRSLGEGLDSALVYGSGASNQIGGVQTINAIGSSTQSERTQVINYTKANLSYSDTLSAIEKLGVSNIPMAMGIEWMGSWKFWKDAKQVAMLTNGSIPIWYEDMIADFPANVTSQIKEGTQHAFGTSTDLANADHGFVANWMYLIVAMWGGLDLVVDPFSKVDTSQIRVVGFYRVDCGFAYDEAFIALQRTA